MPYENVGANRLEGLSTDTKPGAAEGTPINMILYETDTNTTYKFDGEIWQYMSSDAFGQSTVSTKFIPLTNQANAAFGDVAFNRTGSLFDPTTGDFAFFIFTGTSSVDSRGYAQVDQFAITGLLPKVVFVFDPATVDTSSAFFAGIYDRNGSAPVAATYIPNSIPCVGIGYRTTDTNYMVFHNDNVGAVNAINTGIARDTSYHKVSIQFLEAAKVRVIVDDGAGAKTQTLTTEIPPNNTTLKYYSTITNGVTGTEYKVHFRDYVYLEKKRA